MVNFKIRNFTNVALILSVSFLLYVLTGCKSHKKEDIAKLIKLENDINSGMNTKFDETKADSYIEACKKFAESYPDDTLSASYIFKAGRMAMNLQEPEKANESIILFDKLIKDYPESKDAPLALFMKAFYLENNMKNLKQAEETYKEFLKNYPKHQLAPDAQKSIEFMGKPLEQIIQEFQAKTQDTAKTKTLKTN
jgi:TolA-binding protein